MKWWMVIAIFIQWEINLISAQEIILMPCTLTKDSFIIDSTAYLLSSFNPNDITTTPSFLGDNSFLVSANFPDSNQVDIWKLDLADSTVSSISATTVSEYAPQPDYFTPHRILFIRKNGANDSKLWFYPVSQQNQGNALFDFPTDLSIIDFKQLNNNEIGLLIQDTIELHSTSPHTYKIIIFNSTAQNSFTLTNKVLPMIQSLDGNLYFIHQIISSTKYLKVRTPGSKRSLIITTIPFDINAICPIDENNFLAVSHTLIYYFSKKDKSGWLPLIDLHYLGLKAIHSLQYKDNKLLIEGQFRQR